MRKWMRDRLQRRKKKAPEQGSQPAPPPLQPAYFDLDQADPNQAGPNQARRAEPESSPIEAEVSAAPEPEFEAQPAREESAAEPERPRQPAASAEGQRARGRRRRGGRGRGGRGREQAVAQAFTPAAAKGIVPELPGSEKTAIEEAEPEEGASQDADAASGRA